MDRAQQDLRGYYEAEARLGLRKPLMGRRLALRDEFVALLLAEGRRSVVDLGCGPGDDGEAFASAGLDVVGIDLAHGNAVLAAERGVRAVQGSVDAPPFRTWSFDAAWSMSTLMHLREHEVPDALSAMTAMVRPGAPFVIGLWGGEEGEVLGRFDLDGHRRLFSLRPFRVNHRLFAAGGTIEHASTWDLGPDESEYQVFRLRVGQYD